MKEFRKGDENDVPLRFEASRSEWAALVEVMHNGIKEIYEIAKDSNFDPKQAKNVSEKNLMLCSSILHSSRIMKMIADETYDFESNNKGKPIDVT